MFAILKKFFAPPAPSLEMQLATLAGCGIRPASPEIGRAVLLRATRTASRHEPYMALLLELGEEANADDPEFPDTDFSNNIWHLDTECIWDHGDYVSIARRLAALTQGSLEITEVRDHVDIENGIAWLSFRAGGEVVRWEMTVDDDWVSSQVFDGFAALLAKSGSPRRYTWFDLQGQDCLIGCATANEKERLERETGLKVQWYGD